MRLDIQQLLAQDGGTLSFDFSLPLGADYGDFNEGSAKIKGGVSNHGGYLLLTADVDVAAEGICSRCGEGFDFSHSFRIERPVARKLVADENDEYILTDEDGFIDLSAVFDDELLLELPTKLLCRESCKGLCPKCGKNLNKGSCNCPTKEIDPRLEVLKALLDNG